MDRPRRLPSVGGRACLAFANTLEGQRGRDPHEHVPDYERLVAWALHAGLVKRERARDLESQARRQPAEAARVHRRALRLREALFAVFSGTLRGRAPAADDLALLNEELTRAMGRAQLAGGPSSYRWDWSEAEPDLTELLWPIARSAAELLTSPDIARLRECPGDDCDDLFIDDTKNGSRRWCQMQVCGNRAKAQRFRRRS